MISEKEKIGTIKRAVILIVFLLGLAAGLTIDYIRSPESGFAFKRKILKVDYQFYPHSATTENLWGKVSKIETYYDYNGMRVLHGERVVFPEDGAAIFIESYMDGTKVGGVHKSQPYPSELIRKSINSDHD